MARSPAGNEMGGDVTRRVSGCWLKADHVVKFVVHGDDLALTGLEYR